MDPSKDLRDRDGGRYPGLRHDDALRGALLERRPWSVRLGSQGLFPRKRSRRRQRVPPGRRGGERRRCTQPRRAHPARAAPPVTSSGTRPSLGPGTRLCLRPRHVSSFAARRASRAARSPQGQRGRTRQSGYRVRANLLAGGTGRGAPRVDRSRLAACHGPALFGATAHVRRQNRDGGRGLLLEREETRARTVRARTSYAVAEVVRRRSGLEYARVSCPPKRGAARVNRDLARSSAGILERGRTWGVRRNERRDPDHAVEPGRGIGDVPGWRENTTQRFGHRASGDRIAGPGQPRERLCHRILRRAP